MISAKDTKSDAQKAAGVKRVRDWLEGLLPEEERDEEDGGKAPPGKETSVIVNQLACKEVGCPDVEVVMTLLRAKPRPKLMFKIYKAASELTLEEVSSALKMALAEEQGTGDVQHEHGHAEAAGSHEHGHEHGAACCEHGHADDHKHAEAHDHGHAEAAAGHDHAQKGGGDCCEHGHADAHKHAEAHEHGHVSGHGH